MYYCVTVAKKNRKLHQDVKYYSFRGVLVISTDLLVKGKERDPVTHFASLSLSWFSLSGLILPIQTIWLLLRTAKTRVSRARQLLHWNEREHEHWLLQGQGFTSCTEQSFCLIAGLVDAYFTLRHGCLPWSQHTVVLPLGEWPLSIAYRKCSAFSPLKIYSISRLKAQYGVMYLLSGLREDLWLCVCH